MKKLLLIAFAITNYGLAQFQPISQKNKANGYVGLNGLRKIDTVYLPSVVLNSTRNYLDSALSTKAAFFTASAPLFRSGTLLGINNGSSTTTGAITSTDWNNFNNKISPADTLNLLNGRLSSITLNTSGTIHTTPTTFTRVGGAWSGTLNLATQSANTVFAAPNTSSGVPSFRQLVEADISSNASTSTRGLLTSTDWNTFNNSRVFPNYSKVRIYTAIIRVYVDTTTNSVVWSLLNDTDHDPIGVSSIETPNSSNLRINFSTPFKTVFASSISMDETLCTRGIVAGPSVGLSFADIKFSAPYLQRFGYNFNGTNWVASLGNIPEIASVANSGSNIVITNSVNIYGVNSPLNYVNMNIHYSGTNNRIIRYVTSGVGNNQTIVQLVDPATGNVVSPNSSDRILIFSPHVMYNLNTQSATSGLERYAFGAIPNVANIWCTFIGEIN